MNGVRSPASLSSKKLHQHADGHVGGVATEFSRTPGKKLDGNRNGKNAVVSLEDDFVSAVDICCIILLNFAIFGICTSCEIAVASLTCLVRNSILLKIEIVIKFMFSVR